MRKLLSVLVSMLFVVGASFAQKAQPTKVTPAAAPAVQPVSDAKMTFDHMEVDYGTLVQGADGVRKFPFINDGTEPLLISSAKGSCGCTVPRYPKEPIMPGAKAEIEVRYDTKRIGAFKKTVRMQTNASATPIVLTIKGVIEKEPEGVPVKGTGLISPQG